MAMHAAPPAWACAGRLRAGAHARGLHAASAGLRPPWIAPAPPWSIPHSVTTHARFSPPPVLHRGFGSAWRGDDRGTRRPEPPHVAGGAAVVPPLPPLPLTSKKESQAYQREIHTVTVAICANLVIFAAKLATYFASGSSAMLAETVHSVVDTFNQVLLRVGIVRSKRAPTRQHPYGYMKDKFVWSLVSAVGIFCLGAGLTCAHGFNALMAPPPHLDNLGLGLAVLGLSFVVEGYSLLVATRAVVAGAAAAGLGTMEFIKRGMDPTSIAVMLEDGAAVAGLVIAGMATWATHVTGLAMYDAVGSITIGCLLGCTAIFLIGQNRSLLIGRAMNPHDMQRVLAHLKRDPVVKAVYDAKSEEIGPNIFRFKAEIEFHGERIVEMHMQRLGGKEQLLAQVYSAIATRRDDTVELALRAYGKDMVGALGAEVDRLESEIKRVMPGIRHIDLETDRGHHDKKTLKERSLYSVDSDLELSSCQPPL